MTQAPGILVRLRPAVPLVILALGVAIRIYAWWLDPSLWLDEQSISINIRERPMFGLAGDLAHNQSAPLGWLLFVSLVTQLFGFGDRVLHLVPLIFSIGSLVLLWLIGRRWLGHAGTTVALLVAGASPWLLRYTVEVKQYSADTFTVLAILGVAAWVTELGADPPRALLRRRLTIWWSVAALSSMFSMAAITATPAIALVLAGWLLLHRGWRSWTQWRQTFVDNLLGGLIWLGAFALHYALSLRFALGDPFLTAYWENAGGFPDDAGGIGATARWVWALHQDLIESPLVSELATNRALAAFWLLLLVGWAAALRWRPVLGALLVSLPVSAVLLAVLHVVPLVGRLALWLAPVAYLALGAATAFAVRGVGSWARGRTGISRLAAPVAAVTALVLLLGVVLQPMSKNTAQRLTTEPYHQDRAAVDYLLSQRRPGDPVIVVDVGDRAWTWYADTDAYLTRPDVPGPDCDPQALLDLVAGKERVFVLTGYVRYAIRQKSPTAGEVLVNQLATIGKLVHTEHITDHNVVYLLDLTQPPSSQPPLPAEPTELTCTRVLPSSGTAP